VNQAWVRRLLPLAATIVTACAPAARAPAPVTPPPPPPPPARAVIGAILPQSGSPALQQYGELVLQGVRLALDSGTARWTNPPQLVVLDDAGDAERDAALLGQLERQRAVAVIGPLLSAGVASAARARADTALAVVSPTASSLAPGLRNTYSLNQPDAEGFAALGRFAARTGIARVALLYPRIPESTGQAQAFAAALRAAGGTVVADVPYDSGTNTFKAELKRVADANPDGLFVPAPERDVRQLAPQISYYGVSARNLRILGGPAWTSDEILRLVSARYTNGVIAVTPLLRESPAAGWQEFARLYEGTYKRTLDTPFPALGYDAARLVLLGLSRTQPRRADIAHRLAGLQAFRGATGVLAARAGTIVREPFIVRIDAGKLVPLETPITQAAP